MIHETAITWSWMNILTKKRYEALQSVYGDLDTALQHVDEELLQGLGCRGDSMYKALNRFEEFDAAAYSKALEKAGITLLTLEDQAYPAYLQKVTDAPIFLYCKGDLSVLQQPSIALVGTRKMSAYGKRAATQCAQACVAANITTISGLAAGIDTVVAEETLAAGGKTIAVLAHGLGHIYPAANRRLATAIIQGGGVLLSEFPLDQQPDTYTFPARNRIVAGASIATIVIEAPKGSGALITADLALGYGREVFAVPGQIFDENYTGCHGLLQRGQAKILTSATDALRDVGIVMPTSEKVSTYKANTPEESAIWQALSSMPQGVDDIMEKSGLQAAAINANLTIMELQGAAENIGSNQWVRAF